MSNYALIIDYKYCTGCHTCEIACRKEKSFTIDEYGIKVTEQGPIKLGGKWMYDFVPIPSSLCDVCEDRINANKKPACVHHCLSACMTAVPVEKVSEIMADKGNKVVCFIP